MAHSKNFQTKLFVFFMAFIRYGFIEEIFGHHDFQHESENLLIEIVNDLSLYSKDHHYSYLYSYVDFRNVLSEKND